MFFVDIGMLFVQNSKDSSVGGGEGGGGGAFADDQWSPLQCPIDGDCHAPMALAMTLFVILSEPQASRRISRLYETYRIS